MENCCFSVISITINIFYFIQGVIVLLVLLVIAQKMCKHAANYVFLHEGVECFRTDVLCIMRFDDSHKRIL